MSALLPAAFYGLQIPGGDVAVDVITQLPAAIRITMAAIDTSEEYEPQEGDAPKADNKRCVLKIIRLPYGYEEESDSEEEDQLKALINGDMSDSEEEDEGDSEDEMVNGGPSDPEKSKKARKEAATKALKESLAAASEEIGIDGLDNKGKGKLASLADDIDEEDEEDEGYEDSEIQEFVLCTLDPDNHYQQTLDFTIGEKENVLFKVTGNYSIHLSGNYVIPVDDRRSPYDLDEDEDEDEDEDYDLSPDEDELDIDFLDDLADPRIVEIGSDDEDVPTLVDTGKKGKKRSAEYDDENDVGLDEIINKSLKPEGKANSEPPLSKKQQKKLKNNAGQAVPPAPANKTAAETSASKKVQFAKNLEQGPTGSVKKGAKANTDAATSANVRALDGVTIDDRKTGKGPAAKKGSKVSMRYIGKLTNGKVFDSNKGGKPFSFKLGAGEVIKGWDIGIAGMQAGGERRLTIPADKAYGKKAMPDIPGNSTLIFDVKCLEIK